MPPALSIRGLRFRYRAADSSFALEVPNLDVGEGEHVLLTGKSGGGKSTLLQLISGLLEPEAGQVLLAGEDIHALRGAARDQFRGRRLGMIFQTFHLAHGFSAIENVQLGLLFGNPSKDRVSQSHRARAVELLDALQIERRDALVETLSVGQQQRVAVARALACHPALVLADEPTASLDPENADRAIELLRATCRAQGAALLVVSHDPTLVGRFDRHVALDDVLRSTVRGAA